MNETHFTIAFFYIFVAAIAHRAFLDFTENKRPIHVSIFWPVTLLLVVILPGIVWVNKYLINQLEQTAEAWWTTLDNN